MTLLECFRKNTFGAWIWFFIFFYFFNGNRESYCLFFLAQRVTRNMDSDYEPIGGRKNGSVKFCSRIWLRNIFSISRDHSFQNKIWVENMLVATYLRALIALKICWKVTSDNRFDSNFWTVRNSLTRPNCFRKNTFRAWIWANFFFSMEIRGVIVVCI